MHAGKPALASPVQAGKSALAGRQPTAEVPLAPAGRCPHARIPREGATCGSWPRQAPGLLKGQDTVTHARADASSPGVPVRLNPVPDAVGHFTVYRGGIHCHTNGVLLTSSILAAIPEPCSWTSPVGAAGQAKQSKATESANQAKHKSPTRVGWIQRALPMHTLCGQLQRGSGAAEEAGEGGCRQARLQAPVNGAGRQGRCKEQEKETGQHVQLHPLFEGVHCTPPQASA